MLLSTTKLNIHLIQTALDWLKLLTINSKKYWNLQTIWEWLEMHFRSAWYAIVFYIIWGFTTEPLECVVYSRESIESYYWFRIATMRWHDTILFSNPTTSQVREEYATRLRVTWTWNEYSHVACEGPEGNFSIKKVCLGKSSCSTNFQS